jgi:hypothetical protein
MNDEKSSLRVHLSIDPYRVSAFLVESNFSKENKGERVG